MWLGGSPTRVPSLDRKVWAVMAGMGVGEGSSQGLALRPQPLLCSLGPLNPTTPLCLPPTGKATYLSPLLGITQEWDLGSAPPSSPLASQVDPSGERNPPLLDKDHSLLDLQVLLLRISREVFIPREGREGDNCSITKALPSWKP